ncbi:dipeptidase E [Rhodococcus sp. 27YEA15]|uniref:Type 1 glutamine amidotransferase-like domain-containing protein n=1 Tax=Rhodococcus sp. 27YEA15 TaxID=3156259 RepID=UPI003C7A86D8
MKLFLSSYRFGDHQEQFTQLVGRGARIAVIAAAADAWPARARASAVTSDVVGLSAAAFTAEEVDLRHYEGSAQRLRRDLRGFDCLWVRGGNTFVLRAQLARTGADHVVDELVRGGELTYAGYSAGACVAGPTLTGIDAADDPADVPAHWGVETLWSGLHFVDFAIVPHAGDSLLENAAVTAATIRTIDAAGIPYRALSDEQAVIVDQ